MNVCSSVVCFEPFFFFLKQKALFREAREAMLANGVSVGRVLALGRGERGQ